MKTIHASETTSVKELLRERRLTQRGLSIFLDRGESTVNKYANGLRPNLDVQKKICEFLNTGTHEPLKPSDIWGDDA